MYPDYLYHQALIHITFLLRHTGPILKSQLIKSNYDKDGPSGIKSFLLITDTTDKCLPTVFQFNLLSNIKKVTGEKHYIELHVEDMCLCIISNISASVVKNIIYYLLIID